ncbi:MAG: LysR substrate-binding domain-containing protein, partial [Pikeienuella sp.]
LLLAVRQILGNILVLENLAGRFNALSLGEISIGVHNTSSLGRLAAQVDRFKTAHPRVLVRLRDGLLPDLLADLQYGRLDMVFGRLGPDLEARGFGAFPLAETRMMVVARDSAPPPPDDPASLLRLRWAIPLPGTPMREDFDRFRARHGGAPIADCVETNNVQLMLDLLMRGDRYAIFPTTLKDRHPVLIGRHPLPWLKAYPFPEDAGSERVGLIHSTANSPSPALSVFLTQLREDGAGPDAAGALEA